MRDRSRRSLLEPHFSGKIFFDQSFVVWPKYRRIGFCMVFGIEIVLVEEFHPGEHLAIAIIHQIGIFVLSVGCVK